MAASGIFAKKDMPRLIRHPGYDYCCEGSYFITIVTHARENLFGSVTTKGIQLNDFGRIVEQEWLQTGKLRAQIRLGEFVIMPDHFHGILSINETVSSMDGDLNKSRSFLDTEENSGDRARSVPTVSLNFAPQGTERMNTDSDQSTPEDWFRAPLGFLHQKETNEMRSFGRVPENSVSSIVRAFKSAVTRRINIVRLTPGSPVWKSNFHEHIIRSKEACARIARYVQNNPFI